MAQQFRVFRVDGTSDSVGKHPSATLSLASSVDAPMQEVVETVKMEIERRGSLPPVDEILTNGGHVTVTFSVRQHEAYDEILALAQEIDKDYKLESLEHDFRGRPVKQ